jgi:hypothetical protein
MGLYDSAVDVGLAAVEAFAADENNRVSVVLEKTFESFNKLFARREATSGDVCKGYTALKNLGNAKMTDLTTKDTSNVGNVVSEVTSNWYRTTTNWSYNRVHLAAAANRGDPSKRANRVFDYMKPLRQVSITDMANILQEAIFLCPTSSSDTINPIGISGWLTLGTASSTGGWTGYLGRYNDGVGSTTFNVGNIASSESVNPLWASYYADHKGQKGDYLLTLIDKAQTATSLMAPKIPEMAGKDTSWRDLAIFTTLDVIMTLKSYIRKAADNVKGLAEIVGGTVYINNVPVLRAPTLETARTTLYGTDPVFGIDLSKFFIKVLEDDNFVEGRPRQRDEQHNWYTVDIDVSWAMISQDRRSLGFLISQHA